ncbi:MAG: DUF2167 domain-containing protein [Steroidobacteraceae bacterium]
MLQRWIAALLVMTFLPGTMPRAAEAAATDEAAPADETASAADAAGTAAADPQVEAFRAKLRALHWVSGPATVDATANSRLKLPEGYVFLGPGDTKKFNELNENLGTDKEVMFAPDDLHWSAFLTFDDEGYVKDDEKIDAPALLKALQENTEAANEERKRRGWGELHVVGWSQEPKYNAQTKRLEWATRLRSANGEGVNYFTKILGRRGVTTVVLAAAPEDLADASASLNATLEGYSFNAGHTYAEWIPGDKVAEYGLAGLIIGGGAAAAAKAGLLKGLWKFIVAAFAAGWKLIVVAAVAVAGFVRRLFGRKERDT